MDLLLTHGYFLDEDAQERKVMKPYPPLGLLYVSSHLKARGFDVGVFDSTFARFDDFAALLAQERPSVVGVYCNLMTKPAVLRMAVEARRAGAQVVLGGPDPPYHAEEYLRHGADVVVVGEGELTLEELVPRLLARPGSRDLSAVAGLVYRDEAGRTVRTPPRALIANLDSQPLPDREAIDVDAYLHAWRSRHGAGSVSLVTARGCPYTCRWCSRSVFGETHRRRSPECVADEVAVIRERYRPDMLWYVDDVFTIHKGWTLRYQAELARRGLEIPFECITRAERVDEDVARALAAMRCFRVWIGSESGSQRILDAMDRRVTIESVRQATRLLRRHGVQVGLFVMLGYEGEEEADLAATIEHLKRSEPDVFLTTVAYPIRGTPYHDALDGRLAAPRDWTATTDRELVVRGRHTPRYYRFARRWVEGSVRRHRLWSAGDLVGAARAATSAGAGRVGMALFGRERQR
jgi:radical SAM superfamily enzyme YgiQ (UPF0313 family)